MRSSSSRTNPQFDRAREAVKPSSAPMGTCIKLRTCFAKHSELRNKLIVSAALVARRLKGDRAAFENLLKQLPTSREKITKSQVGFAVMLFVIQPGENRELRQQASFYGKVTDGLLATGAKSAKALVEQLQQNTLKKLARPTAKRGRDDDGSDNDVSPATRTYTIVAPPELHDKIMGCNGREAVVRFDVEKGQGARLLLRLSTIRQLEEVDEPDIWSDAGPVPTSEVKLVLSQPVSDHPTPRPKPRPMPRQLRLPAPVERALPRPRARAIDADFFYDGFD